MTKTRSIAGGSDTSGRRGGGIVPAPPSSSSNDGPSRELPARSLEESTRAEAGRAPPRDPRLRGRSTASDAGGDDPLARPGPSTSAQGGPGGQRGKRRRTTGPDSSPEGALPGRSLTRAEAREILARGESSTPTTTRRSVGEALEVLDAVECLRVKPTRGEMEGVTVGHLLGKFGRDLSTVRCLLSHLGSMVEGTGDDDRVDELERVVRVLREEKSELQAEVDALRRDMRRLREDLLSSSASVGVGPPEPPADVGYRRIRREDKAKRRRKISRLREGVRAEERGGGPPPMHDAAEFPPLPPAADGWTTVTGRRARETGRARQGDAGNRAPAGATAGPSGRRAGAPKPSVPASGPQRANPGGGNPTRQKRGGQPRRDRRRADPKTAAVTITALGDRPYADIMRRARATVDLEEIGVNDVLTVKRAINGGYKLEISGPDNSAKADRLARDLEGALEGVAKIARPTKLAEIRIVGLDDSATREEVVRETARVGECPQSALRTGEIRRAASGLGALWMRLPLSAANRLAAAGRIRVGWASAGVRLLEERPLQCYACLRFGHAAAACRADARLRGRCFNCGGVGHEAQGCVNRSRCPLCLDDGRNPGHRMGGRACRARDHPAKRRGLPSAGEQPGRVGDGRTGTRAPDRHSAAPGRTAEHQARRGRAPATREARAEPTEGGTASDREVMPPPPPPREARVNPPVVRSVDRIDLTTQEETQRSEGEGTQVLTQATAGSSVEDSEADLDMEWDDWGEQANER